MDLEEFMHEVNALAVEKGWYAHPRTPVEALMLVVGELSEAVEEIRKASPMVYYDGDKPEGEGVEIADTLIRLLDYCAWRGIPIVPLLREKHAYNKTRPYRHGGKIL